MIKQLAYGSILSFVTFLEYSIGIEQFHLKHSSVMPSSVAILFIKVKTILIIMWDLHAILEFGKPTKLFELALIDEAFEHLLTFCNTSELLPSRSLEKIIVHDILSTCDRIIST